MNTFLSGKIVEIGAEGYFLKKFRGMLVVYKEQQQIAEICFDDIQAVIFNCYDLTYTHNLITEFSERKIPVIFCDAKHLPCSIIFPFDGYFHQSRRMLTQAQVAKPVNKRLWKEIVVSKISQQALLLKVMQKKFEYLQNLILQVRSDDITNCESQAARYYFSELFGSDFIRDRELDGINSMLNYGYIIFRSAVARAIVAVGLNPSFGIKHCNPNNSMPLVDDIIEPFRPFIDKAVYELIFENDIQILDKTAKSYLVSALSQTIVADSIKTTPNQMIYKFASSLGMIYEDKTSKLYLPTMEMI